jgi:hypothetical protein
VVEVVTIREFKAEKVGENAIALSKKQINETPATKTKKRFIAVLCKRVTQSGGSRHGPPAGGRWRAPLEITIKFGGMNPRRTARACGFPGLNGPRRPEPEAA